MIKVLVFVFVFILFNNVVIIDSLSFNKTLVMDQGCFQSSVSPNSGYMIPDRSKFELTVTLNTNISTFWFHNVDYQSISDQELLLYLNTPYPIFYLYNKETGLDHLPSIAASKGTTYKITLTFTNLPISKNLVFIQDLGLLFNQHSLGPKATISYSTNNMVPPQPTIHPNSLDNCPIIKNIDKSWSIEQPSNMQIYPTIGVNVLECTSSTTNICSSNEKYYYDISFPLSLAKGNIQALVPSFLYQAYRYEFKETKITVGAQSDSQIHLPLEFDRYYSMVSETMMLSKNMSPVESVIKSNPIFISESQVNKVIQDYRSNVYDKVYFTNTNLGFTDQSQQFIIDANTNYQHIINNYQDVYLVFVKNNVGKIYLGVGDKGIARFYLNIVDCPNQSKRNVYTVDAPSSTKHIFLALSVYKGYMLSSLPFIIRNFDVSISNTMMSFHLNHTGTENSVVQQKDSVAISLEFNTQASQYATMVSNSKYLYDININNNREKMESSILLPNSWFGTAFDKIGVELDDLVGQSDFCLKEFGTNIRNQIQHALSDGGYSLDRVLPYYGLVSGLNRIELKSNNVIEMKSKSDYAKVRITTSKPQLKEPVIHAADVEFTLLPGGAGSPCDGRVQVDIRNSGDTKGLVNFQLDCQHDVFIEMINYVAEIGPSDKGSFFTKVFISKYYPTPIQCKVSMWIIGLPLWSDVGKALEKNITFSPYTGCNIPDPCLGVDSEPVLSPTSSSSISSPVSQGHFLNSYTLTTLVQNIGDSNADFQVGVTCLGQQVLYSVLKQNIEKKVNGKQGVEFVHTLYIESLAVDGVLLTCDVDIHLYKPNACWQQQDLQKKQYQLVIPVPYDLCVINSQQQAYIQYSLFNYSHGYANAFFSFNSYSWSISSDQTSYTSIVHHPLQITPNKANQEYIKSNMTAMNIIYRSNLLLQVNNGGNVQGEFTITIDQCSSHLLLLTPTTQTGIINGGAKSLYAVSLVGYATNDEYHYDFCKLKIAITNNTCFDNVGKYHEQDIYVYPHYDACAGNWLEPSLYVSTKEPPPSTANIDIIQDEWRPINKSVFYKDVSFPVRNADYGKGTALSNLVCSGMNTVVVKTSEKSSCFLEPLSSCYHTFRILSDASASQEPLESISCTLDIWFDRSVDTCWSDIGKHVTQVLQITKTVDPCLSFKEPFISTNPIQQLSLNQWAMIEDLVTTKMDYWNTSSPRPVYYKAVKTIQVLNTGDTNATVDSIISILSPTVKLVLDESIPRCIIQAHSYCDLKLTFTTRDVNQELLVNMSRVELLVVDPMICWSGLDKHKEITIQSHLPGPPCAHTLDTPQPWLLYQAEYVGLNQTYFLESDNPLNIDVSPWRDGRVNVSGKVINRGTSGAIIIFDIVCKSNIASKTANTLLVTFIDADKYGYFNLELMLNADQLSLSSSPIIPCVVSATINKQYCWSTFGKSIYQKIPIFPPSLFLSDSSKDKTRDILLGILIPLSLLLIGLLLFYFRKLIPFNLLKLKKKEKKVPMITPQVDSLDPKNEIESFENFEPAEIKESVVVKDVVEEQVKEIPETPVQDMQPETNTERFNRELEQRENNNNIISRRNSIGEIQHQSNPDTLPLIIKNNNEINNDNNNNNSGNEENSNNTRRRRSSLGNITRSRGFTNVGNIIVYVDARSPDMAGKRNK
ncbi:hypothetical protein CYY_000580 [Polysphondylium violaceum]|uniref:Uncharacterized protein n=1 Tax=Polysphondylium violaceum TaxID=133409 RepID=A0A8J4Q3D3_9MYCE|nr:hypothetical protein CYY_000580 [Polysphondylium violaceum]